MDFYFHGREESCILTPPIRNQKPLNRRKTNSFFLFFSIRNKYCTKQWAALRKVEKFSTLSWNSLIAQTHPLSVEVNNSP